MSRIIPKLKQDRKYENLQSFFRSVRSLICDTCEKIACFVLDLDSNEAEKLLKRIQERKNESRISRENKFLALINVNFRHDGD